VRKKTISRHVGERGVAGDPHGHQKSGKRGKLGAPGSVKTRTLLMNGSGQQERNLYGEEKCTLGQKREVNREKPPTKGNRTDLAEGREKTLKRRHPAK